MLISSFQTAVTTVVAAGVGTAFLAGYLLHRPSDALARTQPDARFSVGTAGKGAGRSQADKILTTFGAALNVRSARPKQTVKKPAQTANPIDVVNLVGIVERDGERIAIFEVGPRAKRKTIFVTLNSEVVDQWRVESMTSTRVALAKGDEKRQLAVFE